MTVELLFRKSNLWGHYGIKKIESAGVNPFNGLSMFMVVWANAESKVMLSGEFLHKRKLKQDQWRMDVK